MPTDLEEVVVYTEVRCAQQFDPDLEYLAFDRISGLKLVNMRNVAAASAQSLASNLSAGQLRKGVDQVNRCRQSEARKLTLQIPLQIQFRDRGTCHDKSVEPFASFVCIHSCNRLFHGRMSGQGIFDFT